MYHFRTSRGLADLAFTDRFGGVSKPPWSELNLAVSGDDDQHAKEANHEILLADFAPGAVLADLYQVHGREVALARPGVRPECDGIVTTDPDTVLMVRAADCVPVLLVDEQAGVIGAAHSGRKGLVAGVVPATLERMRELGATRIAGWIGPYVCGRCYEVPPALQEEVAEVAPSARATTSWGTPGLDIGAGVRAQLVAAGVQVEDVSACTRESSALFSYRRDGDQAGRLAGVVRLRREDQGGAA